MRFNFLRKIFSPVVNDGLNDRKGYPDSLRRQLKIEESKFEKAIQTGASFEEVKPLHETIKYLKLCLEHLESKPPKEGGDRI